MDVLKPAKTVGGALVTLAVVAGTISLPVATAQPATDVVSQVIDTIPGAVTLPNLEGLPGTAGGLTTDTILDAAKDNVLVSNALAWESDTKAPAQELSTAPTCAPLMLVAVPGTFEINRDRNPDEPVGMLASLAEPLRGLGSGFSETYITYDADAGVSGISYSQSVQSGVEKTLATILDVQERCTDGRVVLAGFSQGAHIAGDVASLIGNSQTAVDPSTMAGVVLFADPKRDENSNVLVGTSAEVPTLPAAVGDAVENLLQDPSIAQLQMTAGQVSGIAGQLLSGQAAASKTTDDSAPAVAGEDSSPTSSPAPTAGGSAPTMQESASGGFDVEFSSAVHTVAAPTMFTQATSITGYTDTVDQPVELPEFDTTDDEASRDAATGIIVPGAVGDSPRQSVLLNLSEDEKQATQLGVGQAWATPENMEALAQFNEVFFEETGVEFSKVLDPGTQDTIDEVLGKDLLLHDQVGQVYRAGLCEEFSFEDCVSFFSGAAGIAALSHQVGTLPEDTPAALASLPSGNLMETRCVELAASACAVNAVEETSTLPTAVLTQISNTTAVDSEDTPVQTTEESTAVDADVEGADSFTTPSDAVRGDDSTDLVDQGVEDPQEDTSDVATTSPTSPQAAAGVEARPSPTAVGEETTSAAAGDARRPSASATAVTSATPTPTKSQAGVGSRPTATEEPYTGNLGGATTGEPGEGEEVDGISPITMAAVAGGGVAGQRDQGFGDLTGAVVSLCVPGDIVCSLPENSQLARDLVSLGENVTTNVAGVAKEALAGNTRMGGLLAVEAVNTVAQVSGLPPLKLSPETIQMLITLVTGGAMIAAGDPTGAGVAMIASTIGQMPQALPELYAQLQDIPVIIEALPHAVDTAARNLGLTDIAQRLGAGFEEAGMTNITDVQNLPAAATSMATALLEDNSGLMELATNPDYLKSGAHSEAGFRSVYISDDVESFTWSQDWIGAIQRMVA